MNSQMGELPATSYQEVQRLSLWRRLLPSAVAIVLAVALGLALAWVPLPFVIYGPGPTYDVLGDQGDTPILQVEGAQSGEKSDGQLRMVTISERGGPGTAITAIDLLDAWIKAGYSVYRYSDIYPQTVTAEELQQMSSAQMQSSHSTASVAALEYLGYALPTAITIEGVADGVDAQGKVEAGDRLVSISTPDGAVHPMNAASAPFALLATVAHGTELGVTLERDGEEITKTIVTSPDQADPESRGSKLGIVLSFDIDMPVDITFNLEKVGGPSAGMIFALGIIDELGGEDLTGGHVIAGTGALGYDDAVQPIGGIVQKMYGASRDGAEYFLAPESNCDEVVGNVPNDLQVFSVSTLDEAVQASRAIAGGDTDSLPTCEAVMRAGQEDQESADPA